MTAKKSKDTLVRKEVHRDESSDTRSAESRKSDERKLQERAIMDMAYADPLYVPPSYIPEGMEYRWIRESCHDQPDNTRLVEARKKGWTPVPAERHQDLAHEDFFGRLSHMRGYIYHRGLILHEREKYLGDLENKKANEYNAQILASMPGTDNFMGEPAIPVSNLSRTYRGA